MKLISFVLLAVGTLVGCRSAAPKPAAPLPIVPNVGTVDGIRLPEVVRAYAVGAYIDPDDPSVRHEAHWIQRVETPARWNLQTPQRSPVVEVAPAGAAVAVLKAETATPAAAPIPVPAEPALEPAITPNADGVVDLTAVASTSEEGGNPFAVQRTVTPNREVTFLVSGIIAGASPSAVVNERIVQAGDTVESLTVLRVESQSVLFRWRDQRLRLPLDEKSVRVRLPL